MSPPGGPSEQKWPCEGWPAGINHKCPSRLWDYGFAHRLMMMSPSLSKACVFGVRRMLDLRSSHRIRGHKSASSGFPAMMGGSEKGQGHSEEPPLQGESWSNRRSVKAAGLGGLHGRQRNLENILGVLVSSKSSRLSSKESGFLQQMHTYPTRTPYVPFSVASLLAEATRTLYNSGSNATTFKNQASMNTLCGWCAEKKCPTHQGSRSTFHK